MCEDKYACSLDGAARIPVSDPKRALNSHADEIRAAIDRVLDGGRYVGGEDVEAFEAEFAAYLGVKYAVAVGSGTDALELALRACEIGPGDNVATVSLTAVATVAAIERAGANPLMIDVDPSTLSLDPTALARVCERFCVKAVIPVHLYGLAADMPRIREVADIHQLVVIEDCAQAHGAILDGRACGAWGDVAAFSFYPTKNLGALGDGGAVTTNARHLAERIRLIREYGWRERNWSELSGINSRLDTLQAAILRNKLRHLDAGNTRRVAIAQQYQEALHDTGLQAPTFTSNSAPVFHQFVVRTANRSVFREHLAAHGVDTAIHYEHPIHRQAAYCSRNLTAGEKLVHTEAACREIVSLPVFPELTDREVDRVAQALAMYREPPARIAPTLANDSGQLPRLSISRPSLGGEELRAVAQVFESRWLGQGDKVQQLEQLLSDFLGNRHVVAVGSGTAALHLALDSLGIKAGHEVIVPSLTFCATVQAITAVGATPVFCEVEPDTLNIDIADAAARITAQTRAIIPVHMCGNACDMDALLEVAGQRGIIVVEDAAHAFGSSHRGRIVGSFGNVTCFSFDPIKNITCGEGGAVVVDDEAQAELLRRKRTLGMRSDRWQRTSEDRSWWYQVDVQGYRYHMSNINAAIGIAQLRRLTHFRERKRELVRRYNDHFASLVGVKVLRWQLEDSFPFCYILRVMDGRRDGLHALLSRHGIDTGVHYIPNHLQPAFATSFKSLPVTERVYDEIITLPLYSEMTDADSDRVIAAVATCIREGHST